MPRGKHSTSENLGTAGTVFVDDMEQKSKGEAVKMALVKPAGTEDVEKYSETTSVGAGDALALKKPRPKVGVRGAMRNKKLLQEQPVTKAEMPATSYISAAAPEKPEKKEDAITAKESVSAVETATAGAVIADLKVEKTAVAQTALIVDPQDTVSKEDAALELSRAERLRDELAKMDLTPDWEAISPPPISFFKMIFLPLLVLVIVIMSIAVMVNPRIKIKRIPNAGERPNVEAPAVHEAPIKTVPEAAKPEVSVEPPPPPPSSTNPAQAPAPSITSLPVLPPPIQDVAPPDVRPPVTLEPSPPKAVTAKPRRAATHPRAADRIPNADTHLAPLPTLPPVLRISEDTKPNPDNAVSASSQKTEPAPPVTAPKETVTPEKSKNHQDLLSVIDKE